MSSTLRLLGPVAFPLLVASWGCASTPPPELAEPAEETAPALSYSTPVPFPPPAAMPEAAEARPRPTTSYVSPQDLTPVYFEHPDARLGPEALGALASYARWILDHPEWGVVTLDGHTDARGNEASNLVVGSRRALAVRQVLIRHGVPRRRLSTRSFGEMRPATHGHDESALRLNRRVEFEVRPLRSASR